jgi:MoxR-like ATPase
VPPAPAVRRILQTVPLPLVAPRQRAGGPPPGPPPGQPLVYGQSAPPQQPPTWGERSA